MPQRRQVWPWIVGLLLAPVVVVAASIADTFRLSGEAAALRNEVVAASGGGWHRRIQLTATPPLVATARTILGFVHDVPAEAQEALRAVRYASVAVLERSPHPGHLAPRWSEVDETMARRGWTRVVGVADDNHLVLIYLPADGGTKPRRLCLAVTDGRQLVVVSGGIDPDALADLVDQELAEHQGLKPSRGGASVR